MLMEHETMKLKDQEECYNRELREWKAQLKPRKQVESIFTPSFAPFLAHKVVIPLSFALPKFSKHFVFFVLSVHCF